MQDTANCAIGVMTKAPQPGRSKTRLCPPLEPEQATRLSEAFLRDMFGIIAAAARQAPIAGYAAYAPFGAEAQVAALLPPGTGLLLADGTPPMPADVCGFGCCLLHAVQGMLARGHAAACVLNSDSPTLPVSSLVQAVEALLAPGERIVLGAADDGGYYLLGMRRPHAHLFADITWSTGMVADATRSRAAELGLEVVELPTWYDVDDPASLLRLMRSIGADNPEPYPAPATHAALRRFGLVAMPTAAE